MGVCIKILNPTEDDIESHNEAYDKIQQALNKNIINRLAQNKKNEDTNKPNKQKSKLIKINEPIHKIYENLSRKSQIQKTKPRPGWGITGFEEFDHTYYYSDEFQREVQKQLQNHNQ